MQTTKKKPNIILLVIGTILSAYFGYLVAGAWREGIEINAFLDRFCMVCAYPLNDYVNEFTVKFVGAAIVVFWMIMTMYYTSQPNYMPGK